MAVKRASMRGKGASIFFGDDDEQVQSEELPNSETIEPTLIAPATSAFDEDEIPTAELSKSQSRGVGHTESSQRRSGRVANSETARVARPNPPTREQSGRVSESLSDRVSDKRSLPGRESVRAAADNSATSRLPHSGTFQTSSGPARAANPGGAEGLPAGRRNLQSSTVANSRTARVDNFNTTPARREAQSGTSIADETRAEYHVDYAAEQDSGEIGRQIAFSEFYSSGETHYLMLEPLATRLTTEQMDRLSNLERRIHQGRRRKEPRVTKNSIIRALLEATFDLDLDTRDINSEMELVNRFREALHLASLVGEMHD